MRLLFLSQLPFMHFFHSRSALDLKRLPSLFLLLQTLLKLFYQLLLTRFRLQYLLLPLLSSCLQLTLVRLFYLLHLKLKQFFKLSRLLTHSYHLFSLYNALFYLGGNASKFRNHRLCLRSHTFRLRNK